MAFGNGGRDYPPGTRIYSFAIKTKDLPAPVFYVSQKGDDGKYDLIKNADGTPKTASRVSGNLTSAQPRKFAYEGNDIHSINLTLEDIAKDGVLEVYYVSVGETFLGRNLFNSLLNLKAPVDDIEIGLYQSKPKADAVDKRGFASVALRQHNELVKGLYDPKGTEMPKTKKVKVNGKDQTDSFDLDVWFRAKMAAWCKAINSGPKPESAPVEAAAVVAGHAEPEPGTSEEDDPLTPPF